MCQLCVAKSAAATVCLTIISFSCSSDTPFFLQHFKFGEVQHEAVGTPYTVAPEVIRGSYDERCDVWAIGVIAYLLLSGESPFGGCGGPEPLMQVRDNILRGSFVFEPEDIWANVSSKAKNFIRKLLVTDPNLRPTAREVQKEPWIVESSSNKNDDRQLNPSVVKALVNFKEYSDMRKLLCEVLSFTLIPDQIQSLRSEFEKFDTDGSGEITLSALKSVLIGNAAQGSLGALTEEEVEDIFNAMRVSKSDTTIHWHEFIAAGLSHCKVDERNLRLAFDRLDADHTGYITFENFMDLIGNGAVHNEESLREMWGEAATHSDEAWLSYEDFLLLMKGQPTTAQLRKPSFTAKQPSIKTNLGLAPVMESVASVEHDDELEKSLLRRSTNSSPPGSAPTAGGFMSPSFCEGDEEGETGISMDDGEENALNEGFLEAVRHQGKGFAIKGSLTTPDSPDSIKSRSKSFDEPAGPTEFAGNALRAINLPEHQSRNQNTGDKKSKTPLVVNRELYRAHRQMRLGVLEASKRLEEEQQRRAREEMRKEQARSNANKGGAGLIMRHGGELSADAIKQFVVQRQKEEQKKIEQAVSKGGRRHNRNKTASDIRGMFGGSGSELNGNQLTLPPKRKMSGSRAGAIPDFNPPQTGPAVAKQSVVTVTGDLPDLPQLREATKPGQFRKTNYDPFSFGTIPAPETAGAPAAVDKMDSSVHRHIEGSLRDVLKQSDTADPLNRSSHSGK